MKITKMFVPGVYEDAYIYMGRLIILTEERSVRIYNLDKIAELYEWNYPKTQPLPTIMFSRNDWLASNQFKSLMKNINVYQSFLEIFDELHTYNVSEHHIFPDEQELNLLDPAVLDILIYNSRLYVGATNGLYQVDIQLENNTTQLTSPSRKHEDRCLSISARYGTVNASCNESGLFTFIDDFGWSNPEKEHGIKLHLANKSLKTAWIDQGIVNYPSHDHPYIFKSSFEKKSVGVEREGKILTSVSNVSTDLGGLLETTRFQKETIRLAYNANNKLFISTVDGKFFTVPLKHLKNDSFELGNSKRSEEVISGVLTVNQCKTGAVIETSERIILVSEKEGKVFPLSEFGAISVRTFPRSRRFQNLITIVNEDGLFLVSTFDDTNLQSLTNLTDPFYF